MARNRNARSTSTPTRIEELYADGTKFGYRVVTVVPGIAALEDVSDTKFKQLASMFSDLS